MRCKECEHKKEEHSKWGCIYGKPLDLNICKCQVSRDDI